MLISFTALKELKSWVMRCATLSVPYSNKAYVQQMLEQAADEASEIIEKELKQDEFVAWVKACSNVLYKGSKNVDEIANAPALAQISKLVDTSNIKPKFKDTGIRFGSPKKMLTGIRLRTVQFKAGKAIREDCNDWSFNEAIEQLKPSG